MGIESDLSIVNSIQQHCCDVGANSIGKQEYQHSLPAPRWDFSRAVKENRMFVNVKAYHISYFEVPSYLEVVPKIHPMTRLHTPFPAILMERARDRAVPRVDSGTTMAIEGHEHSWKNDFFFFLKAQFFKMSFL